MKKPSLRNLAAIFIFVLSIAVVLLVLAPVYNAVSSRIYSQFDKVVSSFQESTGLRLSYKSLSPSVFTGLRIKNITLTDEQHGETVVEIKKTEVRYSIPKFLRGEGLSAIKDITVDGLIFEIGTEDNGLFKKIKGASQKGTESSVQKTEKVQEFNIEKLLKELPFNVFIKNVHLKYKAEQSLIDLHFKKVTMAFLNYSRQIMIKTSGGIKYSSGKGTAWSAGFSADGYIPEVLEGSSVVIRFSDVSNGNYALNHLNLVVGYKKRSFELKTIQNGYPLFISASYNLDDKVSYVALHLKNLKPNQIVSIKKSDLSMKKIKNLSVTLNASSEYNHGEKKLKYSSDGKIFVPEQIYEGGFTTQYSLDGTEKSLVLESFNALGDNIDVDFSGSYEFEGMKLSGELNVNSVVLKNGGVVSTEVYFDPGKTGFMAFAPQLMLDDKAFTALQLSVTPINDSVDFNFELSDYSHAEAEKAGLLRIDGSYIGGTKYVQANLSSSGMYLDSVAQAGAFFKKEKSTSKFAFLAPYVFNGEFFVSTDFKNLSYNIPYAFLLNTKKENNVLFISLDGNDSSVQLSRASYLSDGKMINLSAMFEKSPDGQDAFFMADMTADSIPYHFAGNIMPEGFSLTGDYGIACDVHKSGKNRFDGSFSADSFPLGIANTIFTLSADSVFSYSKENGINLVINRFEGAEAGGKYTFAPNFKLAGSVTKYGVFLDQIVYSDKFSSLEGSSELLLNMNGSIFDSANLYFNLKNPLASEAVGVTFEMSNPGQNDFSGDNLKKNFYFNTQIVMNSFGLNRFTAEHSENNQATGTIIASGTLENPYVGVNLDSVNLMTAGKTVGVKGSAYVEEKNLTVDKLTLNYNNISIGNVTALFDLNTFTGKANAELDTIVAKKTVHAPIEFTISDSLKKEGQLFPAEFAANLVCEKVSGTFLKKTFPFSLTILHTENATSVFTSETQGISGTIARDGNINFEVAEGKPVQFNLTGNTKGQELDIKVHGISVNVGEIFKFVDIAKLKIYNGIMKGRVDISGLKSDPEFKGSLSASGVDFSLPSIISQHITVNKAMFIVNHNELEMPTVTGMVRKDFPITAKLNVLFDRWSFERLELKLKNPEGVYMPGDFEIRLAHFVGDVNLDLLLAFQDHYLDVTGDVLLRKTTGSVKTRELANAAPKRSWWPRADLRIYFGQHCTFIFDPLLRAVVVPNTDFGFKYDMAAGDLELDGELAFRSGDISYLSRNFYLKNGYMKFNSNDPTFNPLINIQAETRERDEKGNDVRIILSANNQYLLNINPQFTSIPAKSETEIRTLLGQIAVGDSENVSGLLFATGDYAIQSTIGRSIENKLRDFLNFDILSVRTNVLQNALSYGLKDREEESENKNLKIGNFFDNSTVYLGKYFGSSLYMDALMHWSYDETRIDDSMISSGLIFRPEFGLEVESPFGNIRWNMSPDINGIRNDRFVSSTSVTLSWKFSF